MNTPTAKDFYNKWVELTDKRILDSSIPRDNNIMEDLLIEFARLHCEAQAKAIHSNMQLPREDLEFTLDAYPLENIK